jgi:hypothetical protein
MNWDTPTEPVPAPVPRRRVPWLEIGSMLAGCIIIALIVAMFPAREEKPRKAVSYQDQMGIDYAHAWRSGATELKKGMPVDKALAVVHDEWSLSRVNLFVSKAAPRFDAIIPSGKKDEDTTHAEKIKLAEEWEKFASELEKP